MTKRYNKLCWLSMVTVNGFLILSIFELEVWILTEVIHYTCITSTCIMYTNLVV